MTGQTLSEAYMAVVRECKNYFISIAYNDVTDPEELRNCINERANKDRFLGGSFNEAGLVHSKTNEDGTLKSALYLDWACGCGAHICVYMINGEIVDMNHPYMVVYNRYHIDMYYYSSYRVAHGLPTFLRFKTDPFELVESNGIPENYVFDEMFCITEWCDDKIINYKVPLV